MVGDEAVSFETAMEVQRPTTPLEEFDTIPPVAKAGFWAGVTPNFLLSLPHRMAYPMMIYSRLSMACGSPTKVFLWSIYGPNPLYRPLKVKAENGRLEHENEEL